VLFDRYELVDAAVRVVGVGSVGTRCYIALFMADGESPLFLQVKEARASVLENYLNKSEFSNHGQRVVIGQRLLQSSSDIFLGWAESKGSGFDFYVRQLRDMKGSFDYTSFELEDLSEYAEACGYALARAMSKAGDPALISGYVGRSTEFDRAIENFAIAYADQNEADWLALKAAVKTGRVDAAMETLGVEELAMGKLHCRRSGQGPLLDQLQSPPPSPPPMSPKLSPELSSQEDESLRPKSLPPILSDGGA
jgi:hypothetical protein